MIMKIRELTETDLKNEKTLKEFIDSLCSLRETQLTSDEAIKLHNKRTNIKTYLVFLENEVVATGSIIFEPKFIRNGCVAAHIEDVAVKSSYQGQGVGLKLIRYLIDRAKEEPMCYKIILNCDPGLISFYKKNGFKPWEAAMRLDF